MVGFFLGSPLGVGAGAGGASDLGEGVPVPEVEALLLESSPDDDLDLSWRPDGVE